MADPPAIYHRYQSLDRSLERKQIRVLHILAGETESLMRCTLQHIDLNSDSKPVYETVSYAYGDASERMDVEVDGLLCSIPVAANQVLNALRRASQTRVIWIDAVCIDQQNIEERGHQVAMMSEIYSSSCGNVVYLGDMVEHGIPEAASRCVKVIYEQLLTETEGGSKLRTTMYDDEGVYRVPYFGLSSGLDEHALCQLFSCKWFQRLWVVQEAALAPESTCLWAGVSFNLVEVLSVAAWVGYKAQLNSDSLLLLSSGRGRAAQMFDIIVPRQGFYRQGHQCEVDMVDLIDIGRQFQTTEEHDKIYALLGMLSPFHRQHPRLRELVIPDYKRPMRDLLCDATCFAIAQCRNLYPLQMISHRTENEPAEGCPSWVFRGDRPFDEHADPRAFFGSFNASLGTELDIDVLLGARHRNPQCLQLSGVIVATVKVVGPVMQSELWTTDDKLGKVLRETVEVIGHSLDSSTANMGFGPTSVAGARMPRISNAEDNVALLGRCIGQFPDGVDEVEAKQYRLLLWKAARCRRMFYTTSGDLGLGPRNLQIDDLVVVLHGGAVPFALRQLHGGGYTLIGQLYVQGMMKGEAMAMLGSHEQHGTNLFDIY